jgi:hypothetical protein
MDAITTRFAGSFSLTAENAIRETKKKLNEIKSSRIMQAEKEVRRYLGRWLLFCARRVNVVPEVNVITHNEHVTIMTARYDRLIMPRSRLYQTAKSKEIAAAVPRRGMYDRLAWAELTIG